MASNVTCVFDLFFTGRGDFNGESYNNQSKPDTTLQQNSEGACGENMPQIQQPFQFNSDSWNDPKQREFPPSEPKPSPWDRARGGFQDVYVSSVATPSNFWLQLVNAESVQLDQLQESITTYCNAQSKVRGQFINIIQAQPHTINLFMVLKFD